MKKKNSKTPKREPTSLIIAIGVLLIVGSVGYYFDMRDDGDATPRSEQTMQVYSWKTYTNPEYGISFKYPATWSDPTLVQVNGSTEISFKEGLFVLAGAHVDQVTQKNLSIDDTVQSVMKLPPTTEILEKERGIVGVNNKNYVTLTLQTNAETKPDITVYIPHDSSTTDFVELQNSHQAVDGGIFASVLASFEFMR